jgi:hypothetical protein
MAVRKVRGAPTGSEIPFAVRVVAAGIERDAPALAIERLRRRTGLTWEELLWPVRRADTGEERGAV